MRWNYCKLYSLAGKVYFNPKVLQNSKRKPNMQIALSMDRCLRAKGDASPLRSWKTNFSPVCLLPLYNAGVSSLIFVNTRWGKTIFLVVCFSIAKIQSRARRRVKILKKMSRSFSFNYPSNNHWVSDYWRRDWVLFGFFFCTFPKLLNLISLEKLHIFDRKT